jgi:hypothetical protein
MGQMDDVPDDFQSRLAYRIVYGEVARLAEIARLDHGYGRDFAAQVGDQAEVIQAEVTRRVGRGFDPGPVKLAVEDAVEQRRSGW